MDLDHDCSHCYHTVSHPDKAVVVKQVLTLYKQDLGRLLADTRHHR